MMMIAVIIKLACAFEAEGIPINGTSQLPFEAGRSLSKASGYLKSHRLSEAWEVVRRDALQSCTAN